jgi:hypothetical protein
MPYVFVFVVLAGVLLFVTAPLRRAASAQPSLADANRAELEAAREAKLRELTDAELDHRTGKLSDADYEELDRTLRGEAITIMHDLDRATIDPQ